MPLAYAAVEKAHEHDNAAVVVVLAVGTPVPSAVAGSPRRGNVGNYVVQNGVDVDARRGNLRRVHGRYAVMMSSTSCLAPLGDPQPAGLSC